MYTPSGETTYETPTGFVRRLAPVLGITGFDLDVCATGRTSKAPLYFGPDHRDGACRDALAVSWGAWYWHQTGRGVAHMWCNPPYGRQIHQWTRRALHMVETYPTYSITLLLPGMSRDAGWWHDMVYGPLKPTVALDVRGRLQFLLDGDSQASPKLSNVVLHYRRPAPVYTQWLSISAKDPGDSAHDRPVMVDSAGRPDPDRYGDLGDLATRLAAGSARRDQTRPSVPIPPAE